MVQISRQGKASTPNKQTIADRIKPIEKSKEGRIKLSLYGMPKTGKTSLACTFPKPLLIIGSEDGTASVVGTPGVDFIELENCNEFAEIVNGPLREPKYQTVVLDNATGLRDLRIAEILGLKEMPLQKGWGFASHQEWGECAISMKEMLGSLFDLTRLRKVNVIVIAHEANINNDDSVSDIVKPKIGSALGKSVCNFLNGECDYIGQTFIRKQKINQPIQMGEGVQDNYVETGKVEFCLRVGPHDTYITGFRLPQGKRGIPECIVDPTYDKILSLIRGNVT